MVTGLRKFVTIETKPPASKDLRYTIIPGEMKKNYCKIIYNIRYFSQNQPITLDFIKKRIMLDGGYRVERHYKSGNVRPERQNVTVEQANSLISDMIQQGYIKFLKTVYPDKLHPNIPEGGLKYYVFDQYKVIECQESKYIQSKIRRQSEQTESKGKLSEKRCRALRQIYAQFGDKTPFTYNMVINIPKFYKKIAEGKLTLSEEGEPMKPELKQYYFQAAQYAESRDEDFLNTWNSLVRNNYIIPYEVRAKDGTRKIRQGAFKVNMLYARKCLSAVNM